MYFKKTDNVDNLKQQYRILAEIYHPDKGGDNEIMQTINIEYEKLLQFLKKKSGKANNQQTGQGNQKSQARVVVHKGERYESGLDPIQFSRRLRNFLRREFGMQVDFRVDTNGNVIKIALQETYFSVYKNAFTEISGDYDYSIKNTEENSRLFSYTTRYAFAVIDDFCRKYQLVIRETDGKLKANMVFKYSIPASIRQRAHID